MSTYQRIEYRIGKDGKVTETVIGATGQACIALTAAIEGALGVVETQEYLPEYDELEVVTQTEITAITTAK